MCQLIIRKVHAGIKNDSCMRYEVVVMQMVDFSQYEQNQRMYGGTAGRKMGIVYEGKTIY